MKIRRAFVLLVVLLLGAIALPLPAGAQSPATLRWAVPGEPGTEGNLVASPSEVSDIAIGPGGVFYAIDNANDKVYRSPSAGVTWEDVTTRLDMASAVLPATKIAVAPDRSGVVAVVTNAGHKVFLSLDGGTTWFDTSVPGLSGTIQTITMSKRYLAAGETLTEIAIGTAAWGDNTTTGQVWVFPFGGAPSSWQNQHITVDPGVAPDVASGEISAIAYSPNYQLDKTILVIASTAGDVTTDYQNKTWLGIGRRNTSSGTTLWNTVTNYPVEISTAASPSAGDASDVSQIISSLALPSGYFGTEASERQVFASYNREPDANDDVYRLDDTTVYRMEANRGAADNMTNIAYYGTFNSGVLLAGDVSRVPGSLTVQVRRTTDPFDSSPTWRLASQPPSGPEQAHVSWNSDGTVAYCGTGQRPGVALDESAFSRSLDGGDTWEQIGLIDTAVTFLDVAAAPSPRSLFVATASEFGPESVWRSAGEPLGHYWGRVLTMDTASDNVILRLSPDYRTDYTLYAAEADGTLVMVSHNRGNSWYERHAPGAVIDMAVADRNTVYIALSGGRINRSTNGAWFWEDPVSTSLPSINMLSVAAGKTILVGGQNGEVAYSADGATFTRAPRVATGNVWVAADTNYNENGIIYAGNGHSIYRMAVGAGSSWEGIRTLGANQQISGLTVADGVLYGAWYDTVAGDSGVERCLEPTGPLIEWDTMDIGAEAARFDRTPSSFQTSSAATEVSLWAINTATPALMVYEDTVAKVRPTPTVPAQVLSDPVSGRNTQFTITWPAVSTGTEYDVEIHANESCTALLLSAPAQAPDIAYRTDGANPAWVVGPGQLTSGRDYYVRLRVRDQLSGDQVRGLWSSPVRFTVAQGAPVRATYIGPILTAPGSGATGVPPRSAFTWATVPEVSEYELVLAEDSGFTQIVAGTPVRIKGTAWQCPGELDYGTTYFWRVRTIAPVAGDWSAVARFTTMAKPEATPSLPSPQPAIVKAESPPSSVSLPSPQPAPAPVTSVPLIWLAVGVVSLLVIALVVLIVRTGR